MQTCLNPSDAVFNVTAQKVSPVDWRRGFEGSRFFVRSRATGLTRILLLKKRVDVLLVYKLKRHPRDMRCVEPAGAAVAGAVA